MKKLFSLLVLLLIVLAGCSSQGDNNATEGAKATQQQKQTQDNQAKKEITLGGWTTTPQEKKFVNQRIQEFEKKHPDVNVNFQVLSGDYNDTLQVQLGAGKAPDVFYQDANFVQKFIDKGAIKPLDNYLSDDVLNGFHSSVLAGFQKNGSTYGLPKDMNTLVLYYDQGAFDKYGMDVPKTWDELKKTAKFFANKDEYDAGLVLRTDFPRFLPFILQNGGQILSKDGKPQWASKNVAEAYDYYFNTLLGSGIAKTAKNFDGNEAAFTNKKVPMMISGGWATQFVKDNAPNMNWKMAKLPGNKKDSSVIFTVAYVMNSHTKYPQAAADFIKFMTSEKAQEMVVDSGIALPTRKEASKYYAKKNKKYSANPDQASYSQVYSFGVHGSKIADLLTKAGEEVRLNGTDPMEALKNAEQKYLQFVKNQ